MDSSQHALHALALSPTQATLEYAWQMHLIQRLCEFAVCTDMAQQLIVQKNVAVAVVKAP